MGHTLVTEFSSDSNRILHQLLHSTDIDSCSKIPFGRNCDREAADRILPYHVTVFHWSKENDQRFLQALDKFHFTPCQIIITGSSLMYAEEGSLLLYFDVTPGTGYRPMLCSLENALHGSAAGFLHMTLAVSQNHALIQTLKKQLDEQACYPFTLDVTGLALYHIWKPVSRVKSFQ